jgi:hypothetical protein
LIRLVAVDEATEEAEVEEEPVVAALCLVVLQRAYAGTHSRRKSLKAS